MACWIPRELAADSVLTPYGQLRPLLDRAGTGMVELVDSRDASGASQGFSWRRAVVRVPCGRCPGCEIDWRREWTTRFMCEFSDGHRGYSKHKDRDCWFATFTFDPVHVPRREVERFNREGVGSTRRVMSLEPEVWAAFEKRLRDDLRYWYEDSRLRRAVVGEYGSKFHRPHFHALLLDCPIEDARPDPEGRGSGKYPLWVSSWLTRLWGLGAVWLGKVSRESASYVFSYMAKSARWPLGVQEPFRLMSSGSGRTRAGGASLGGVGSAYFDNHWEEMFLRDEGMILVDPSGPGCGPGRETGTWMPAPRYFRARFRESRLDEWIGFERARLAKAAEVRASLSVNSRQARISVAWERLVSASRDGTVLSGAGVLGGSDAERRELLGFVKDEDGVPVPVQVVHRFNEHVAYGAYGRESGFALQDYLDEVSLRFVRESREVPVRLPRHPFGPNRARRSSDGSVLPSLFDEDGSPLVVRGACGDLRPEGVGGVFAGMRASEFIQRSGVVLDVGELAVPAVAGVVRAGSLPADFLVEAGVPLLRRSNG